jgi:ProP effector
VTTGYIGGDRVLELLAAKFPRAFFVEERERRPLKCGVFHDLQDALPGVRQDALRDALRQYVSSKFYLTKCKLGAARIGLDGETRGAVSDREARFARMRRDEQDIRRRRS